MESGAVGCLVKRMLIFVSGQGTDLRGRGSIWSGHLPLLGGQRARRHVLQATGSLVPPWRCEVLKAIATTRSHPQIRCRNFEDLRGKIFPLVLVLERRRRSLHSRSKTRCSKSRSAGSYTPLSRDNDIAADPGRNYLTLQGWREEKSAGQSAVDSVSVENFREQFQVWRISIASGQSPPPLPKQKPVVLSLRRRAWRFLQVSRHVDARVGRV